MSIVTQKLIDTINARLEQFHYTSAENTGICIYIKTQDGYSPEEIAADPVNCYNFEQLVSTHWDNFKEAKVDGDFLIVTDSRARRQGTDQVARIDITGIAGISIDVHNDQFHIDEWVMINDTEIMEGYKFKATFTVLPHSTSVEIRIQE